MKLSAYISHNISSCDAAEGLSGLHFSTVRPSRCYCLSHVPFRGFDFLYRPFFPATRTQQRSDRRYCRVGFFDAHVGNAIDKRLVSQLPNSTPQKSPEFQHVLKHVLEQGLFVSFMSGWMNGFVTKGASAVLSLKRIFSASDSDSGAQFEWVFGQVSAVMSDKRKVPLHFQVTVEERLQRSADKRWQAQFCFYPLGYFRGEGYCPAAALAVAWKNFRREVDPGKRWWTLAMGAPPMPRF